MNYEQWFIFTLRDLEEHLERKTEYHIIRAAGLLRHLLLDNPRLLDLANRQIRQKIRFRILDTGAWASSQSQKGEFELWSNAIAPVSQETYDEGLSSDISLDHFLKTPMFKWKGYIFDVKEVIRLAAHIQGGVHHGKPHDQREAIQHDLAYEKSVISQPVFVLCLIQIALVVIESLKPLEQQILKTNESND
jgi:hypothetical protein